MYIYAYIRRTYIEKQVAGPAHPRLLGGTAVDKADALNRAVVLHAKVGTDAALVLIVLLLVRVVVPH